MILQRVTRSILLVGCLSAIFSAAATIASPSSSKADRPNIILMMADDMGFSDIGPYGGEIPTPNLDRLAKNGVKFTHFYNAGRCYPTRASMLTGLHPHQTGIGGATNSPKGINGDRGVYGYRGFLNRNSVTLAEVLGSAGYSTYMTGKWHLGYHTPDRWPLQRGFDRFYGVVAGASSYFKPHGGRGIMIDNEAQPDPEPPYYTTDAFADNAVKYINEHKSDNPYFLYLAFTSPHWPLHAKEEDIKKFVGKYKNIGWDKLRKQRLARMKKSGLLPKSTKLSPRDDGARAWSKLTKKQIEELDYRMAVYVAQVYSMDYNIGKVIDAVEKRGELDNTIIIFLSDNGGCAEPYDDLGGKAFKLINDPMFGGASSYGQGWANASNTPFRQFKVWQNEGGISTPFIVHWPKGIKNKKGAWVRTPAYLPDIMPTFVELAGAEYPETFNGYNIQPMEGQSLVNAFKTGDHVQHTWMFWEHMGHRAVRHGPWKALWEKELASWALYNIDDDRNEMKDLSKKKPELLASMIDQWNAWAKRAHVVPKPNKLNVPSAPKPTWPQYRPQNTMTSH